MMKVVSTVVNGPKQEKVSTVVNGLGCFWMPTVDDRCLRRENIFLLFYIIEKRHISRYRNFLIYEGGLKPHFLSTVGNTSH